MKLAPRSFKIEWDVHAWVGVVASILLFVVFYCGCFALLNRDFTVWQLPRAARQVAPGSYREPSFDALLAQLTQRFALPTGASLALRRTADSTQSTLSVYGEGAKGSHNVTIDRATGVEVADHSRLAEELYELHFFYQIPFGIELAGVAAMALLVSVVTGLLIHLKDLGRQIWQFRPRLKLRFSLSDVHKVLGVFGLPFTLMYGWSGVLLGLWSVVTAPFVYGAFGGDEKAFERVRGWDAVALEASGQPAAMQRMDALVSAAQRALHAPTTLEAERMYIEHWGDRNAYATVHFPRADLSPERTVVVSVESGAVLRVVDTSPSPAVAMDMVLYDLHYALFGGRLVRLLYVLLALAVCAVCVTGNVIWLERRDVRRKQRGNCLLERLTVGVCLGLVFASAVYCALNRVLPVEMAMRADREFQLFCASWLVASALAFVPSLAVARYVTWCSLAGGALFALVCVSDLVLRADSFLLEASVHLPSPLFAHLFVALMAVALLWLARVTSRTRA